MDLYSKYWGCIGEDGSDRGAAECRQKLIPGDPKRKDRRRRPCSEQTESFSMVLYEFCVRALLAKICRAIELIRLYRRFQAWRKAA
jgi:hypothetical protein